MPYQGSSTKNMMHQEHGNIKLKMTINQSDKVCENGRDRPFFFVLDFAATVSLLGIVMSLEDDFLFRYARTPYYLYEIVLTINGFLMV